MIAFVFGKNWMLSLAEIMSYFEKEQVKWSFVDLSKKALMVEMDAAPEIIENLGGTLKIVQISKQFKFEDIAKQDFGEYVDWPISLYGSHKLFKNVKKIFKKFPKDGVISHTDLIKRKKREVCLIFGLKTCYFGETVAVSNPFDFKRRDENRPAQRPELSISPHRARILLNLSQARDSVLDPFCGIGTIGQEALLAGIPRIYLADVDKKAVEWTKKNMEWSKKAFRVKASVSVQACDARNLNKMHVEAIATEPDLGPKLQFRISKADAEQIIHYLTDTYRAFFSSAWNVLPDNGRLAIVLPCINSKAGKIFVNKYFKDYRPVDLFKAIPDEYKEYLKIRKTILDEEREKGKARVVVREFCVYRKA
jgi:tRNA G10  N-methylase Trm11